MFVFPSVCGARTTVASFTTFLLFLDCQYPPPQNRFEKVFFLFISLDTYTVLIRGHYNQVCYVTTHLSFTQLNTSRREIEIYVQWVTDRWKKELLLCQSWKKGQLKKKKKAMHGVNLGRCGRHTFECQFPPSDVLIFKIIQLLMVDGPIWMER